MVREENDAISEMFDNKDENGIYPTTRFFERLDAIFLTEIAKYQDALIWCSGSEDFQVGGKAREGWEKICLPLLQTSSKE